MRDWSVRRKLAAIVMVPTVALLLAAGVGVHGQLERAQQAGAVQDLAVVGRRVTSLVHQLQRERDVTAGWVARGRTGEPADMAAQRASVDVAVAAYLSAIERLGELGGQVDRLLANVDTRLASLSVLRKAVSETALPGEAGFAVYGSVITDLLALIDQIGQVTADRALAEPVRALDALARAKEFVSQQRGLLLAVLSAPNPRAEQLQDFLSAADQERGALVEFRSVASPEQRRRYEDAVTGPEVDRTEQVKAAALVGQDIEALGEADAWLKMSTAKLDLIAGVETVLLNGLAAASVAARDRTLRGSAATIGWVLLAVAVAFMVMLLAARSLGRRLDALRGGALTVANVRLPEAVARLRDGNVNLDTVGVDPIEVVGVDEVGEVARAFDAVQREAVRLASEQALLRARVNEVFVSLARRSQSLVQRQLRLLYDFERDENDPDRLDQLFKVDHLATRMRRNDESLLVLAGSESPRPLPHPAPLTDAFRAALAEVEQYTRVDCAQTDDVYIAGYVFADLVHLLAELLENATTFSSPQTRVAVSGRRLPHEHGLMIEIDDHGIGMSREQLAEANARLDGPPAIDAAALESMGLYVVGCLAARHGIDVQLRASPAGGVVAVVRVPVSRLADPSHQAVREVTGIALAPPARRAEPTVELPVLAAGRTSTAVAVRTERHDPAGHSWRIEEPIEGVWRPPAAPEPSQKAEITAAGLPVRAPQTKAFPGSVGRHALPDGEPRTASLTGNALASFQAAVESGRASEVSPSTDVPSNHRIATNPHNH